MANYQLNARLKRFNCIMARPPDHIVFNGYVVDLTVGSIQVNAMQRSIMNSTPRDPDVLDYWHGHGRRSR
jgi:hypothetical protein